MTTTMPAREAPFSLLRDTDHDATRPPAPDEPVLAVANIQGNLIGFNKDHQTLLFLKITSVPDCKQWLDRLRPYVATAEEVLAFNRLFKALRSRRKKETGAVQATWINLAFSFQGLTQLNPEAASFQDASFRTGMAAQSALLGDPTDASREGCASNWVIGGSGNEADIVLIVASDDADHLRAEVGRLEDTIYAPRLADGTRIRSGVQILYKQHAATLPPPHVGHEHFGFLDGVSQPALRGRLSEDFTDVLTLRQNPSDSNQGKPGQDLLWPGEFVFGYQGQNPNGADKSQPGNVSTAGPSWGNDGSFLVIRRLRQDVPLFRQAMQNAALQIGLDPKVFTAKCVGRWPSGAPILRAADADNPALGDDDCANNHFEFQDGSQPIHHSINQSALDCYDETFAASQGDQSGQKCPFASHIRKVYPRDDVRTPGQTQLGYPASGEVAPTLGEVDTQTHRMLRRGIPFGLPFPLSEDAPVADSGDRGLLFLSYQTSIVRQFEFVTRNWVNDPNFKDGAAGHDPIIGQNGTDPARGRTMEVPLPDGTTHTVNFTDEWVIPTGGGYFFAPSLSALEALAS